MGTFFINAGLAAGVALASLPVILHLFMKQTPKHIVFPALRLIRERQKRSRKRLRIKNWLLLLARMALIALMALALARPRLWSKTTLGDREVRSAIAMVFDTSLSMAYKERDQTRLDEAKKRAHQLLERAHQGSRVFVIDSFDPVPPVPLSPAAALKRVDSLTLHAVSRPLNLAVNRAYKAIAGAEEPRREVFVLTDLANTAWELGKPVEGLELTKKDAVGTETYILRLLPKSIHDASVIEAVPMTPFVSADEPLQVQVRLRNIGPETQRLAEILIDGRKRGQREVKIPTHGEAELQFESPKLGPGLHQGEVRLAGEPDPLEADDHRYFTLDVQPALNVLLISDRNIDAYFVANALQPSTLGPDAPNPFHVTRLLTTQLEKSGFPSPLGGFSCVYLINVQKLDNKVWSQFNQYVRQGGSLVVALGDRVDPASYNSSVVAQLMPGSLGDLKSNRESPFHFGQGEVNHPLFQHDTKALLADLANPPVYTYRQVEPADGVRAILSYQNGDPALLERVFPGGRSGSVMLWTTALSRRPGLSEQEQRESWTDFPLPVAGWGFLALMNESVPYLAGLSDRKLTYEAGEDVTLPMEPGTRYNSFAIKGPGLESPERLNEPVSGSALVIPAPPRVGQWSVIASGPEGVRPRTLGFSVNPPSDESVITPLTEADLTTLFGTREGYHLIDQPDDLKREVEGVRTGKELFPLLMLLILILVTLENALANTFYREKPATGGMPQPRRAAA